MGKFINSKKFPVNTENVPGVVDFIKEALEPCDIESKERVMALLKAEDIAYALMRRCPDENEKLTVTVVNPPLKLGKVTLAIRCKGKKFVMPDPKADLQKYLDLEELDEETNELLNSRLEPLIESDTVQRRKRGVNEITLILNAKRSNIQINLLCLFLGLLFGAILGLALPAAVSSFISDEICGTIVTIFFNLLKMLIVPIVFCSMFLSVGEFSDLQQLGKMGLQTMVYFIMLSIVGIIIGYLVFAVIPCGSSSLLSLVDLTEATQELNTADTLWISLKNVIYDIFPSNLAQTWLDSDVLAVIFLAILFGAATRQVDTEDSEKLTGGIRALNTVVCKVTAMLVKFMPIVIFCSMVRISIDMDFNEAKDLLVYLLDAIIGFTIMFGVFIVIMLLNRINPLKFFKEFAPVFFTAFSLASSSAVIPTSLECCNKAGISKKVSNFVIPLGATINMSGSCVTLIVTVLFIARCFDVPISLHQLGILMVMILLFSMAAPGVPGSMIVMLASLLGMIGIPAEATNIIIGVSTVVGMFMVPVNSMGDAMVSVIYDKQSAGSKA